MKELWSRNTPDRFWQCDLAASPDSWLTAARRVSLNLGPGWADFDELLELILGEGQFGPHHWDLSWAKTSYYRVKTVIPRPILISIRRAYAQIQKREFRLGWPIESRFVDFLWQVMREMLLLAGQESCRYIPFWPPPYQFAVVLTHDVESAKGQAYVRAVADFEEELGFRSSFNLVPERYPIDFALVNELQQRGFEVGIHGLRHDGKLTRSWEDFSRGAERVNEYLKQFKAVGFRAPYTLRHPVFMQCLEIEYDLSFFDTDPYEPIAGGVMTLWPFEIGRFIELPYTLAQDHTLTRLLRHTTPQVWLDKINFIQRHHGMALLNAHPDYLLIPAVGKVYRDFLRALSQYDGYWQALPRDVARWWRRRTNRPTGEESPACSKTGQIALTEDGIVLRDIPTRDTPRPFSTSPSHTPDVGTLC
ncbi:MAG: hypothetical protein GYB65_08155 [Chloroflexi bacterium]|nr:hypothetical protein [Chloroflexota bacterium]